jgi:hypothetical protein
MLKIVAVYISMTTAAFAQIIVAPPNPRDQSCEARAARMYPWASQSNLRAEMIEHLCLRDNAGATAPSLRGVGTGSNCTTFRTEHASTTVCN